ncbi:TRAP transporter small permease [Nocardiopsis sp. L17-MgMaSL7]|uniref:TRAP transporter small permease n=1 Tax=Nocardiopsis sp. L17-MgMaSL7 TaxID=1938893 RepID=UPI000D81A094|nr:TRAP transporter small permease subunit [Nocardiopsis sp. L17-MgMaSL7]PWV47309.1 TRAP-type C4-dicarboxylate transport system permease small subunit [Nocardiopsis sp. L17-MgMaSL7]
MTQPPEPNDTGPPSPARTVVRCLERAELVVGALLLTLIFTLMLVQATQRHLPVSGWVWTGELARFGLVWLTFSLVGYLVGRDEHITLKLVDHVARGRVLRGVWVLANLVVAAVAVGFVFEAAELVFGGSPQTTPALNVPLSWTYVIPMVGLSLAALRALANTLLPAPPALETTPEERAE